MSKHEPSTSTVGAPGGGGFQHFRLEKTPKLLKKINVIFHLLSWEMSLLVCQFESDRQVFHDGGTSTFTTVAPPKKQKI